MEKRKHLSNFFFIFFPMFLCIIIEVVAAGGCFWSNGYFINVVNDIYHSPNKVMVHCKSKDNDIGVKTIGFNQSVEWKFCEKIWTPSTLFFCHFYMGNVEQVFDVYNNGIGPQCVERKKEEYWRCTWLIKTDGFYFVDRTSGVRKDVKKYAWKAIRS
ncbi:hypothetical protein LXL04_033319 [Taraxacum kok-saghyz]